MADEGADWKRLHELGLTEYQAKAYATLTQLGRATATELSNASGVPQPKVYRAAKDLEELRLVQSSLGPPVRFVPLAVTGFVKSKVQKHREAARRIEAMEADLERTFSIQAAQASPARDGYVAALKGRRNLLLRVDEAVEGARKSLLVAIPGTPIPGFASRFHRLLETHAGWPVGVRLLMHIDERSLARAKSFARFADVRHATTSLSALAIVVDRVRCLVGHAAGADAGRSALDIADPELVLFIDDAVAAMWAAGVPLETRVDELQGRTPRGAQVVADGAAALAALRGLVGGAKKTLDLAVPEMGAFQLHSLAELLKEARGRGCEIRILAPRSATNRAALDALSKLAGVRHTAKTLRVAVADGATAMVLDMGPGTDSAFLDATSIGDQLIVGGHTSLVGLARQAFEAAWRDAP